jgi:uroporphyrinogen-III synthase
VDAVTFASASAVQGFMEAVGPDLARRAPAISIGPVTSDAIREAGMDVAAESREASIPSLVDAVKERLAKR